MKSIVTINLQDKEDFTSPYNNQKLSSDLLAYILDEQKGIPLNQDIKLEVHSNHKFTEQEKNHFIDMFRSNIGEDIKESYLEMKFIQIRAFLLILLGIFFLLLALFISKQSTNILSEIMLVIGWVGIWEATYIFLFDNVHTRIKIKKYKKLVNAKVVFHEDV